MKPELLRLLYLLMFVTLWDSPAPAQNVPGNDPSPPSQETRRGKQPELQDPHPRYRLQTGDVLEIVFRFVPEFDQTVTVQPDGYISLRDLEDVHVAGKSTPELVEILKKKYSDILRDPVITVVLKEYEKPYFIANGELGHPGKYELRGDTTVLEAIGIAGGFNEKSKHSQVLLFRRVADGWVSVKKLDMKQMINTANLSEDLHLRPGDMIYVPQNAISKIKPYIPLPSIGIYTKPF